MTTFPFSARVQAFRQECNVLGILVTCWAICGMLLGLFGLSHPSLLPSLIIPWAVVGLPTMALCNFCISLECPTCRHSHPLGGPAERFASSRRCESCDRVVVEPV